MSAHQVPASASAGVLAAGSECAIPGPAAGAEGEFGLQPGGTFLTLPSGKCVDLLDPDPQLICFEDVAEQLAKINRYNGATRGVTYSVAEHSVRGARYLRAHYDDSHAAYFLLHDAHEAFIGDDATPKKRAIAAVAQLKFGTLHQVIVDAFQSIERGLDVAIHAAAGLAYPLPADIARVVKVYDRVMLATEWRDLMRCPEPFPLGALPMVTQISPWGWQQAKREFLNECRALLPALKHQRNGAAL
jgi:5'-deoxynucleotidase YfbR-like HD superfamily hydrolase